MSAISDVLIIQDRVSDSMKHISQAMNETNSSTEKLKGGFSSLQAGIVTLSSTFQLIGQVKNFIMGAVSAMDKYISAAQVQTQAEDRLAIVTKQRMSLTDEEVQSLYDLAAAQQKVGVVGDEVAMAGMGLIARYTKQKASIEALTPALNNLAVSQYGYNVTAESMNSIGRMLGMAMQGQTMMLKRLGVNIDDNKKKWLMSLPEQQRAVELSKMITAVTGDMNEEFAKTPYGQITQANNSIGDSYERIGNALVPLKAMFITTFASILETVSTHLATIVPLTTIALGAIGAAFTVLKWKAIASWAAAYLPATLVIAATAGVVAILAKCVGGFDKLAENALTSLIMIKRGVMNVGILIANVVRSIYNGFVNYLTLGKNMWVGFISFILDKLEPLSIIFDKIFKTNTSEMIKNAKGNLNAIDKFLTSKIGDKKQYTQFQDAYNVMDATKEAKNLMNKMSGSMKNIMGKAGKSPLDNFETALGKVTEGGALKTKQQGSIELKDEDIQMLSDLATRDWSVRSQLLAPNVNFGNVTVNENADVSQFIQEFANGVNEVAERSLEVGIGK